MFERFLQVTRHLEQQLGVPPPPHLLERLAKRERQRGAPGRTRYTSALDKGKGSSASQQQPQQWQSSAAIMVYAVRVHRACRQKAGAARQTAGTAAPVQNTAGPNSCVVS